MGKPLTIQEDDDERLLVLKKKTGAKSKVDVLRLALSLLERELLQSSRIKRLKKAARMVGDSSLEVLESFNRKDRFKDLPE